MEKPNEATVAWYQAAVPDSPNVLRSQMFGFPCSFVNGNMFFGTFSSALVARIGPEAVAARIALGLGQIFEPMEGRAWKEYLQIPTGSISDEALAALAGEALAFTAALPAKPAKGKKKAG